MSILREYFYEDRKSLPWNKPYLALMTIAFSVLLSIQKDSLAADIERIGNFIYIEQIDAMSDATTSMIITESINLPQMGLSIYCRNLLTAISVTHKNMEGRYKGKEGARFKSVNIMYRFDDEEPSKYESWILGEEGRESTTTMFGGSSLLKDEGIFKKGVTSSKIAIRVQDPHDRETQTGVFSLDGFDESMERMSCHEN